MSNHLKSFTLATLLLLVIPLGANFVQARDFYAQTPTVENPKTEVDKLFQQGVQQYRTGLYPQALQTYQRVLEIRRQQNDKATIAQTLNNIGEVYNSSPFLLAGRVYTFQNSMRFCGTMQSVSPWFRNKEIALVASLYIGSLGSTLRSKTLVSIE